MSKRKAYPTDLTDKECAILEPLLPAARTGRPREHSPRELLNGVWYVLRTGGSWRMLPHDFPAWQTVYSYFRLLKRSGTWQRLNDELRTQVRVKAKREPEPSTLVVDSQSVKTAEKGGFEAMTEGNTSKDAKDISR